MPRSIPSSLDWWRRRCRLLLCLANFSPTFPRIFSFSTFLPSYISVSVVDFCLRELPVTCLGFFPTHTHSHTHTHLGVCIFQVSICSLFFILPVSIFCNLLTTFTRSALGQNHSIFLVAPPVHSVCLVYKNYSSSNNNNNESCLAF